MFRFIMLEEQAELMSWFYIYRKYFKFGLNYLIRRPFAKYESSEKVKSDFGNQMNELPYHSREMYYNIFLRSRLKKRDGCYLVLNEEEEERRKRMKEKPNPKNFERIISEVEKACKHLNMMAAPGRILVITNSVRKK